MMMIMGQTNVMFVRWSPSSSWKWRTMCLFISIKCFIFSLCLGGCEEGRGKAVEDKSGA